MNQLESLQSIFKERIFKIPDYQRGYAWTTRQLKDFWEDVVNLPPDRFHYTGLLSIKKVDKNIWNTWNNEKWLMEERSYKPFHLVDGQQRLTTFVIFVQSITELLKSLPENKKKSENEIYLGSYSLKSIKEEYLIIQKPPQFIINTHKFSYEVDNPSFKFLKHRILNEPNSGTIDETFYTLNLENAKKFFNENLNNFFNLYGILEVEILFKKLTQNLMFNLYEISDDFDVFVAFETMNNRGKKLSNLELLKNRLIYLTTLYDDKELKTDERFSLRESINDAWKEIYHQLGRNKRNPLNDDDFLVAHWIMYFQYTREKGDDYIRFLLEQKFTPQNIYVKTEVKLNSVEQFQEIRDTEDTDIEDEESNEILESSTIMQSKLTPKEIEDYVNSLKAAAVHWYNTHNPKNNKELSTEESLWIDRLNRIGIIYFRPLVTASFLNENITKEMRVKLFKEIERFIFITFRLGRSFSTYRNSEFYKAARQIRKNDLSIETIIKRLNERMEFSFFKDADSDDKFFDYGYFQKYIDKKFKSGGGFYSWNGLRYFLYEYEMEKFRKRGNQKIDWKLFIKGEKDKVSIEHIYPQTPTDVYWKSNFKGFKNKSVYFQGTLGNLLPLSQSINSSLQNDSFPNKKSPKLNEKGEKIRLGYSDGSHSEIEVASFQDWNPNAIYERGILLLNFMERRWNLKFENEESKKDLLFLDFLTN